jgi:hypothetical protein
VGRITYSIDPKVFEYLGHKSDGRAIGANDF